MPGIKKDGACAGVLLVNLPSNTVSNPAVKYVPTKFRLRDLPNPLFLTLHKDFYTPLGHFWGLKNGVFGGERGNFEILIRYFASGLGSEVSISD
jgi:hypothetical protein